MTEEEIAEIRALRAATTQGEWQWYGNVKTREVYLSTVDRGRIFVMDFVRWGMSGAQPRFQVRLDGPDSGIMRSISDGGPKMIGSHRNDFAGIDHPDATFIARAPALVDRLLAEIDRLRAESAHRDAALDAHAARIAEVMRERDEALGSLAEKTGELADAIEAQAELEAAWEATTIAGCVRGFGVSLAEVITSRWGHFADATRERDEARAALAEVRPPLDAVAYLRELADQEDRTAGEVLDAADDEAQPIDSEQHEHAAAVLRDAADEIERRCRPPLDPAHVEAVQYIRDRLARDAAKLRDDGFTYLAEERDREIAALEAVLAKEAKP